MIPADETFEGTWPFAPHFSTAAGFRQHYVDEGPRDGEVIVCLHGEPTWGYLYRNFIPPLAAGYRVIVPDHMGFGKSETPQDRVYTLQTHVENLEKLLDDLDLRDITFVGQDWGGLVGLRVLAEDPAVSVYLDSVKNAVLDRIELFREAEDDEEEPPLRAFLRRLTVNVLLGPMVKVPALMKSPGVLRFRPPVTVNARWLRAKAARASPP